MVHTTRVSLSTFAWKVNYNEVHSLRPPPLGPSFWAFLFPPVPLVPNMPSDVSDLGDSDAVDARLFPSDDELSQRTIWIAFLLVLGWTFVGLASAIPLYTVGMPCTGDTLPTPRYGGQYSALQDLSLIRLLRLLEDGNVSTTTAGGNALSRRLVVNSIDRAHKARVRLLILTVILLAVSVLPALIKLLKEFEKLLAFRRRWLHIRCQGMEMGWLSLDKTPGFVGLGESAVKDRFSKYGLGALRDDPSRTPSERDEDDARRVGHLREVSMAGEESEALTAPAGLRSGEDGNEINLTSLFSVV
jgi:calcium permeable stress-gated cation channel